MRLSSRDAADVVYHGNPVDVFVALAEMLERPAWWADAACREHPELSWFPQRGDHETEAREVCRQCLVRPECAEAGRLELHGLWGGLSVRERRRVNGPAPR